MHKKILAWVAILGLALMLGACGGKDTKKKDGADGRDSGSVSGSVGGSRDGGGGPRTRGADAGDSGGIRPWTDPASPLSKLTVYFEFDKSEIRPEFAATLRAHADYLSRNPGQRITIEGHCDERGSREYNIGLGERRAGAVKRFLSVEGVRDSQIGTISYGEERPVDYGSNEAAWAKNRRAVIIYQ